MSAGRSPDQELGAEAGLAELGMGEPEVVDPLGHVVGELVGEGEADAARGAVGADQVEAGDLRLLAAVEGEVGREQRVAGATRGRRRCPCRTIPAGRRSGPAAGLPPSRPMLNIFMQSVSVALSPLCMASREAALPVWVRPVPVRCRCAGRGWVSGQSRAPSAASAARSTGLPSPMSARRSASERPVAIASVARARTVVAPGTAWAAPFAAADDAAGP